MSDAAGNPTDNVKTQMEKLAAKYPKIAKLETIGRSVRGVPIYAIKVTKDARKVRDGSRPAVLYSSMQHAREWLAVETGRRTLRLFLDNYGRTGTAVGTDGQPVEGVDARELTRLVDKNELWFVLVANPDGYDYTFDPPNRLWRKNLRDNNGDGQITNVDGVDPNRNFPTHWNYDDEGSNTDIASETYRGAGPASEPETKALDGLVRRVDFAWNNNDHTFGAAAAVPVRLAGRHARGGRSDLHARSPGSRRRQSGRSRRSTRTSGPSSTPPTATRTTTLYDQYRTICRTTPEAHAAATNTGSGLHLSRTSRPTCRPSSSATCSSRSISARSAKDPAHPVGHLNNDIPMFEVDSFSVSYGSPQTVQVNAHRDVEDIELHYRINGGREREVGTSEWRGGETYGDKGDYFYRRLRGKISGARPGDSVKVWFEGEIDDHHGHGHHKGKGHGHADDVESESFTYTQRSDSNARVLILSAEDYTGNSAFPPYPSTAGPFYLDVLPSRARRERDPLRRLERRRGGTHGAPPARRAQPLRRGRLVHGQRQRHAGDRAGGRLRQGGARHHDGGARLHERGRASAVHRQHGRPRV